MPKRVVLWSVAVTVSTVLAIRLVGQTASPERQLVLRAAEALGGLDRVMALKTLQIIGYGELAYMNGGGNITADPDAPQKWQKVLDYKRTIDLEHGRTRVEQRLKMDFVFASEVGQLGLNRTSETLDGDIAYNIGAGFLAPPGGAPQPQAAGAAAARQRRVELLAHPITIVRAALDATSRLSNLRRQGNLQLVDVTVRQGDTLSLAVDAARPIVPSGSATSGRMPTSATSPTRQRSPATCRCRVYNCQPASRPPSISGMSCSASSTSIGISSTPRSTT